MTVLPKYKRNVATHSDPTLSLRQFAIFSSVRPLKATRYPDYFSVYAELVCCSIDLFPADGAQAGHASVPVVLQLDEVAVTELGPILQLRAQVSLYNIYYTYHIIYI